MSSPSLGALLGRRNPPSVSTRNPLLATFNKYSPSQGWATVAILLLTLVVVSESINAAEWVDADGLTAVLIWSGIAALALAKARTHWTLLIPAGLIIGAVAVVLQARAEWRGRPHWTGSVRP